LTIIK